MKKSNKFLPKLFLKNSNGFSLAEIMVAAGMLGVISLGVMQVMKNMQRGSKKLKQDSEVFSIEQLIRQNLKKQSNCTASFRGISLTGDGSFDTTVNDGLTDLYVARNSWQRGTNAAADKVAYAKEDNIYGAGGSRVRLAFIQIDGFYQGSAPGVAANYGLSNNNSTYIYNGDADATDGGADNQRKVGTAMVKLTFHRQVSNRVDDATAAQAVKGRTYGTEKTVKYLPIEIITNSSNVIEECYGDQANFVEASCDSIDGTIENEKCKNIKIKNLDSNTTDPALTVEGNLRIEPDLTVNNPPTDLSDFGSVGVGITPNSTSVSNLDVFGSIGVGAADTSSAISDSTTPGNLDVYNGVAIYGAGNDSGGAANGMGLGVGVQNPPDGIGNVHLTGALGVGVAPPSNNGEAHINVSLGVGVAPSATSGTAQFSNSIAVGSAHTATGVDGEIVAKKAIGAGLDTGTSPTAIIHAQGTGAESAGLFISKATTVDVADKDENFFKASNATSDITINKLSKITIDSGKIVINDLAATYPAIRIVGQPQTDLSISGSKGQELATKAWVSYNVWGTNGVISDTLKEQVVTNILDYAQHHKLDAIKRDICLNTHILYQDGSTDKVSGSYNSGTGACNFDHVNCSESGRCTTVYGTTGEFSTVNATTGNITTLNSTNINWSGNAVGGQLVASRMRTTGVGWISNGVNASKICANGSCSTRFGRQVCPGNSIVKGIANGRVFCALNATTATQPVATDF